MGWSLLRPCYGDRYQCALSNASLIARYLLTTMSFTIQVLVCHYRMKCLISGGNLEVSVWHNTGVYGKNTFFRCRRSVCLWWKTIHVCIRMPLNSHFLHEAATLYTQDSAATSNSLATTNPKDCAVTPSQERIMPNTPESPEFSPIASTRQRSWRLTLSLRARVR